jgi:hypothetical protein
MTAAIAADVDITTLDEFLPELDQPRVDRFREIAEGDITIRYESVLGEKCHELLRRSPKFRLSWEGRRPDLRDQTLSAYEMSLAAIAANASCGAQDICDLLVAFRKKSGGRWHGRSYYRSTIGKALGNAARHSREKRKGAFCVSEEEDSVRGEPGACTGPIPPTSEIADAQKLIKTLNSAVILKDRNLRFTDVKRRGSAYVAFDDQGHEIQLGTVREMNAFSVTQANIAEATGVNLSIPSGKKALYWYPVVEVVIAIAHSQPIEFDYGLEDETRIYLARALNTLTSKTPSHALRVNAHDSEEVYWVNWSVRNGRRDEFLYRADPGRGDREGGVPSWPRFIFWSQDGRVFVQVPMLQMFLGTPIGGNEKITTDRLKQGLSTMRFAIDEIKTGQTGRHKISMRWSISPPAFEVDPDCHPQPGLAPEPDLENESPPDLKVGDVVQWVSQGVLRFLSPTPIHSFSPDGLYAFFDGNNRGVPVNELIQPTMKGNTR